MNILYTLMLLFCFEYLYSMPTSDNAAPPAEQSSVQLDQQSTSIDTTMEQLPAVADQATQFQAMPEVVVQQTDTQNTVSTYQSSVEPEPTYEQLKWPDTLEIEEGKGDVIQNDDSQIIKISKQIIDISDQMKHVVTLIMDTANTINHEFTRVDSLLDDFFQQIGFAEGKILGIEKLEK